MQDEKMEHLPNNTWQTMLVVHAGWVRVCPCCLDCSACCIQIVMVTCSLPKDVLLALADIILFALKHLEPHFSRGNRLGSQCHFSDYNIAVVDVS